MTKYLLCAIIALLFLSSCNYFSSVDEWTLNVPLVGSNSSPKCVDLNNDGILDIVIGAGKNEFDYSRIAVIAIDGKNGDTLWTAPALDQMYGTPIFQDVNNDGTPDVFISGRALNFFCLNGKNGNQIWKYKLLSHDYTPEGLARFNFYNPIFVEDLDEDGAEDLLLLNSGNVDAKPYDTLNRHPGVLMLVSSKTGSVLSIDTVPGGKESYMSPVVYDFGQDGTREIIFGSGGETVSGNLYSVSFQDLLDRNLKNAKTIIKYKNQHGFIAPPIVADFDKDGFKDLLAIYHGGFLSLHSGKNDLSLLWQTELVDVELNAQPTVGYFNSDTILDIFINGALGQWPDNTGSKQFFLDGKDGSILRSYEIGCNGFSSALSANLDDDPADEAILFLNGNECKSYDIISNLTALYIFDLDTVSMIDKTLQMGKNISSTPWIGDLDLDGKFDLVTITVDNTTIIQEFLGLTVKRLEFNNNLSGKIRWGSYMGLDNKCIYEE